MCEVGGVLELRSQWAHAFLQSRALRLAEGADNEGRGLKEPHAFMAGGGGGGLWSQGGVAKKGGVA